MNYGLASSIPLLFAVLLLLSAPTFATPVSHCSGSERVRLATLANTKKLAVTEATLEQGRVLGRCFEQTVTTRARIRRLQRSIAKTRTAGRRVALREKVRIAKRALNKLSKKCRVVETELLARVEVAASQHSSAMNDFRRCDSLRMPMVFNSDGFAVWEAADGNIDRWLQNIFEPLSGSSVTTVSWCDGSGGNTANYRSSVLEVTGDRVGQRDPRLMAAWAAGRDLPLIFVAEAHRRGLKAWYSYRMNDVHDAYMPRELPTFKLQNPAWLLGTSNHPYVYALNFSRPEVRSLRLEALKEVVSQYPFDGLELDFMRSPPFFPGPVGPAETALLTAFMQDVRAYTNSLGVASGRVIEIAVRVPDSTIGALREGIALGDWVVQGLVDHVIVGDFGSVTGLDSILDATRGTKVRVYPVIYGYGDRQPQGTEYPAEYLRGLEEQYRTRLIEGPYLFNLYPHAPKSRLATVVGVDSTYRGEQATYLSETRADQRSRNFILPLATGLSASIRSLPDRRNMGLGSQFPLVLTPSRPSDFRFDLGADGESPLVLGDYHAGCLAIRVSGLGANDLLTIDFNGKVASFGPTQLMVYDDQMCANQRLRPTTKSGEGWIIIPIEHRPQGINLAVSSAAAITVHDIEAHFVHQKIEALPPSPELTLIDVSSLNGELINSSGYPAVDFGFGVSVLPSGANDPPDILEFSGVGSFLAFTPIVSPEWALDDFSYSLWINPAEVQRWQSLVNLDNDTLVLALSQGRLVVWNSCGATYSAAVVQSNFWQHIQLANTVQGTTVYRNGEMVLTAALCNPTYYARHIVLGGGVYRIFSGLWQADGESFAGKLADIRIDDFASGGLVLRQ